MQRFAVIALLTILASPTLAQNDKRPVQYNLDCSEFFVGTFGPVVPSTIAKFVKEHADAGVTDLVINVNAQKANYRSKVWQSYWDGYDPRLPDEQPFFAGIDPKRRFETKWYKSLYAFHKAGHDYPALMIQEARRRKLKPWISLRMNDAHNPHLPKHPGHSKLWKDNPKWRLSNGALDYEPAAVRKHYLKLIREVCQRYDFDGLELDFQRFWLYFRPGREHLGNKLMFQFVRKAKSMVDGATKRLGRKVVLAVRVPSSPWIAKQYGLDAVTWAKAGLVDQITASHFWVSTNSDIPIETWKGLVGPKVKIAVGIEDGVTSGATKRRTLTPEEMRGLFASGLHRGADVAYSFNLFTGPYQRWPRKDHNALLRDAGSLTALAAAPRRHIVTRIYPWAEGASRPTRVLPYAGNHGKFRLHIGPQPTKSQTVQIELQLAGKERTDLQVKLNRHKCKYVGVSKPTHIRAAGWKWQGSEPRHIFSVPKDALSSGYNFIECRSKNSFRLEWVEISIK